MIITTTNSIENAKIEKYLGVVTTNLVIGTNFFSDFKAAFTDMFGGLSGTYKKQMDLLYQKAYNTLSLKASSMGANCVLGFKIDFDEISGKGMQMFMISVSGTAAKIAIKTESIDRQKVEKIALQTLNIALFKERWASRNKRLTPTDKDLDFILENGLWELAESLYDYYVIPKIDVEVRSIDKKFPLILSAMNYDDIVKFIYKDYATRIDYAFELIKDYNLFNAEKVLQLLQDHYISEAIQLLETDKSEYSETDVKFMEEICLFLDNLPNKGKVQEVKAGLLSSKMVEKYICPNEHSNDKGTEYCQACNCGLNIKGLTREQMHTINSFKDKVRVIKSLFLQTN